MTRAEHIADLEDRPTPRWGSPVPDSLDKSSYEEESQIKLRAPLPAAAYYQEDPFPLVRERIDSVEELPISITFDETLATRDTSPVPERKDANAASVPAYGPMDAPYPPSFYPAYFESPPSARDVAPYRAPKRWTTRTVLARVAFGVIFFAIAALLAYEIRILLVSGSWPLP